METLRLLAERGIELFCEDGRLKAHGLRGRLSAGDVELVQQHRQNFLDFWRCRACQRIVSVLYGFPPDFVCRECHSKLFENQEI